MAMCGLFVVCPRLAFCMINLLQGFLLIDNLRNSDTYVNHRIRWSPYGSFVKAYGDRQIPLSTDPAIDGSGYWRLFLTSQHILNCKKAFGLFIWPIVLHAEQVYIAVPFKNANPVSGFLSPKQNWGKNTKMTIQKIAIQSFVLVL